MAGKAQMVRVGGKVGLPVGAALRRLWLMGLMALALAAPTQAATFTPGISVGAGYDDNVKESKDPKGDFFYLVRPEATLEAGQPDTHFTAQGRAEYVWFHRLHEDNRLQEGYLGLNYHHGFTQNWFMEASNIYSTTYDRVELNEQGALTQLRSGGGRRDRNTTSIRSVTNLGPMSQFWAGYSHSKVYNHDETSEDMTYHKAETGVIYRYNADWRQELRLEGIRDDYEFSDDVNRVNAELRTVRMIGPKRDLFLSLAGGLVRSQSDDPLRKQARDYEMYTAMLGYKEDVTPEWGYDLAVGVSTVDADKRYNAAAGKVYPAASAGFHYQRPLHLFRAYAEYKLGEYDNLGQNSGLTVTQRVGMSHTWDMAQHWKLFLVADYILDDFQQDTVAGVAAQGNVKSWRLGANLAYQIARYWKVSLDYRYLERETEFNTDDRTQNRVMMLLSTEWPQRW